MLNQCQSKTIIIIIIINIVVEGPGDTKDTKDSQLQLRRWYQGKPERKPIKKFTIIAHVQYLSHVYCIRTVYFVSNVQKKPRLDSIQIYRYTDTLVEKSPQLQRQRQMPMPKLNLDFGTQTGM